MQNPYEILGVEESAPQSVIKGRYRRLCKLHHPDSAREPDAARFAAVKAAYGQIETREARDRTDAALARTRRPTTAPLSGPAGTGGAATPSGTPGWGEPPEPPKPSEPPPATRTPAAQSPPLDHAAAQSPPTMLNSHYWVRASKRWWCGEGGAHIGCGSPPRKRGFPKGNAWVVTDAYGTIRAEHHAPSTGSTRLLRWAVLLVISVWVVRFGVLPLFEGPDWVRDVDGSHQLWVAGVGTAGLTALHLIQVRAARLVAWCLVAAALYEATLAATVVVPPLWR